ncbi:MAG: polyphosphate kinase 2 family protein [Planctomycetia bacterium]|nr:polyphosphate kinase 2 family protein [Planctomycetia bacterium]
MDQPLVVPAGRDIRLADFDPDHHEGLDREAAEDETRRHCEKLDELAYRLFAEARRAVVVVLQGIDTSGKDGTIRMLAGGISPQCLDVRSFKAPSALELSHDFLWRVHAAVPPHGRIGIFNRSHYEDVVVVRVRKLVPKEVWKDRFAQINAFEKLLHDGGLTFVKCFLHISKDEQRKRLEDRLRDPKKQWKLGPSDLEDRRLWDDFQKAYDDALTQCNTEHAPWAIVPADHKWYRNLVVARLLRKTLERIDPKFPPFDSSLLRKLD